MAGSDLLNKCAHKLAEEWATVMASEESGVTYEMALREAAKRMRGERFNRRSRRSRGSEGGNGACGADSIHSR